ncbi:hypothetical protein KL864_23055 [Mycolicibacterium goodii]|uniref:hypothetical protein n=1 Tax=Mycolicibacterium goodii TaxID=134601 RepID=UPI001BDCAFD5|nr:hypothetical protein [Mycolicibacterium goodii]MBU8818776.1 hypothetical protein [Mycolicibacterium goodii]
MTAPITPDIEVLRDRIRRASEIRASIGTEWGEYLDRHPRRFGLVHADVDGQWTFVINTVEPMPARISTLFGVWLYLLRAALDGTAYHLAVRDSGQNPPPNERNIYFPIKLDPAKYDSQGHRDNLKALSDTTFADLRIVQPFNAQPDHLSNALWWVEELARIDRHRGGHALAAHVDKVRVGLRKPLTLVKNYLPQLATGRVPVDESAPMPILDLRAPADFDELTVREHMDISNAVETVLDVTEWAANATKPMASDELHMRMGMCEFFLREGIIEPLLTGETQKLSPSAAP